MKYFKFIYSLDVLSDVEAWPCHPQWDVPEVPVRLQSQQIVDFIFVNFIERDPNCDSRQSLVRLGSLQASCAGENRAFM
jgi:hypothetical protein